MTLPSHFPTLSPGMSAQGCQIGAGGRPDPPCTLPHTFSHFTQVRLLKAAKSVLVGALTEAERSRNELGRILVFTHDAGVGESLEGGGGRKLSLSAATHLMVWKGTRE